MKREKVPMPTSHIIANLVWRDVFNLRHNSDFRDVTCGLVALSNRAIRAIRWEEAPRGWGFDVWFRKECLRVAKEHGLKIKQVPVDVTYWKSEVEAPLKIRLDKYSKMFIEVLIECVKH